MGAITIRRRNGVLNTERCGTECGTVVRVSIERIKGCKRERGLNCYGYIMKISEGRTGRAETQQTEGNRGGGGDTA